MRRALRTPSRTASRLAALAAEAAASTRPVRRLARRAADLRSRAVACHGGAVAGSSAARTRAALAGVMILLLAAGAAEAQLVSTTGQGQGVDGDFQNDRAQEFTTGSDAPGYNLTRVDLRVLSSSSTTPVYTVEIRNDNGALPGSTVLGTLSNPTTTLTSSYQVLQFTAPAGGVSLDPGTDYWVVVDVSTGDANTKMQLTNSDGEDSGGAAGLERRERASYPQQQRHPHGMRAPVRLRS